jgi:hypothetical protein
VGVTALSSAFESASKLHAKANAIVLSAEAKTDKCASVKVQKLLAHADRMHTLATDIRYTYVYVYVYICIGILFFTCIYICSFIYIGILIYIYISIYIYIYVYMI